SVTAGALLVGRPGGAPPDPNAAAPSRCSAPPNRDYTQYLRAGGLKGARLGIPRAFFYDALPQAAERNRGGLNAEQAKVMSEAIAILKAQGAVIVDPADIPRCTEPDPAKIIIARGNY